jgi:uncharacterized membrane protein
MCHMSSRVKVTGESVRPITITNQDLPATRLTSTSISATTHTINRISRQHSITKHRLHCIMSRWTIQISLRLVLALLLPLFTYTRSLKESTTIFIIFVAVFSIAHQSSNTICSNIAQRFARAYAECLISTYIAIFVVRSPWMSLGLTYLMCWDALWYLFQCSVSNSRVQKLGNVLGIFCAC